MSAILCAFNASADDAVQATPVAPSRMVPVAGRSFDIEEIDVDGNSLLSDVDIQAVLSTFTGPDRRAEDVDGARGALEKLYHDFGYQTVEVVIPKQTLKDGIVLLEVHERSIGTLTINGSKFSSIDAVKSEIPSLSEGTVPDFGDLQKDLVYANRDPARRVTASSLRPGAAPGTVDVVMDVDDKLPLHASVEINNRYSNSTAHQRAVFTAGYDNLFQLRHSFSASMQVIPGHDDQGRVYTASYVAPIADGTWSLMVNGLENSSHVAALAGTDVIGNGHTLGLKLIRQLPDATGQVFSTLSFGIDYKHFLTVTTGTGDPQSTPVTYWPFSLGYSRNSSVLGAPWQTDVSLMFASAALGSDSATVDLGRYGARGDMFSMRGSSSWAITLPAGFEVGLRGNAQYSDRPLISSEQISIGGADTVRGYLESEGAGDYGFGTSVELRAPSIPDLFTSSKFASVLTEFQPYLFGDAAWVKVHGPFPDSSTPHGFDLSSYGAGVTMRVREYLYAGLNYARTLRKGPYTPSDNDRFLFRITASF